MINKYKEFQNMFPDSINPGEVIRTNDPDAIFLPPSRPMTTQEGLRLLDIINLVYCDLKTKSVDFYIIKAIADLREDLSK